jgi:hypothetical protein
MARVAALAGRRVDAADAAAPRFPLANVGAVRERLKTLLRAQGSAALVCSAACGADLIALDVAGALGAVAATGDVVMLGLDEGDDATYAAANEAILNEAERLAGADPSDVIAIIVWEGRSRGEGDLTEAFAASARARGHPVFEVPTT